MHIVIYANSAADSFRRLIAAFESLHLDRPPEIHTDMDQFRDRFRSVIDDPDVVVVMPASAAELDALTVIRDLFEDVRTIVILPSRDPDMLAQGHRFRPRFIAFEDDDFDTLATVLDNLGRNMTENHLSEEEMPAAMGKPIEIPRPRMDRVASFIIDRTNGTELAISAENVLEATPINGVIQPLPSAVDFLEGYMHLRDDAIPVINLKKRLGLIQTEYRADAKVAVVGMNGFRFGILFDDIRDVLHVSEEMIRPVHPAFLTDGGLITEIVQLENGRRTLQLLDLVRLLGELDHTDGDLTAAPNSADPSSRNRNYRRYVIFSTADQYYGIPVEETQEITFLADIDRTFQSEVIEGSLDLRGKYIPVINAARLLHQAADDWQSGADTRVLVMDSGAFRYGMIVDRISEILSIAQNDIMHLPGTAAGAVDGVLHHADGRNILLVAPSRLIGDQHSELKSVARLKSSATEDGSHGTDTGKRHLITAECYLIFSIGRNFAVELNDVQEIIEPDDLLVLPGVDGIDGRVLNLRGTVVPVVDLRLFYGYPCDRAGQHRKLIIARRDAAIVALEVDQILTIYKQVQFQRTPSLNPRFRGKEDTLDRLIEFIGDEGVKEHVLVINVDALMRNHLDLITTDIEITDPFNAKENTHGINTAHPA